MSVAASAIRHALEALPIFFLDRSVPADVRAPMLDREAVVISTVARNDVEAAFLVAQLDAESHTSLDVFRGNCSALPRGMRCDPDRHGVPRASGPWQAWLQFCPKAQPFAIDSVEGLTEQARCVLRQARGGLQRCRSWEGAFAATLGTASCTGASGADRARVMRRALERIRRAP